MEGYHRLRTREDVQKLWESCNYFKNPVKIVTMDQAVIPYGKNFPGGKLSLYLAGKDMPMVKIVFSGVICTKFDNAAILAIESKCIYSLFLTRIWHKHSSEDEKLKTATTSWVLARRVEWKPVKNRYE